MAKFDAGDFAIIIVSGIVTSIIWEFIVRPHITREVQQQ